MAGLGILWCRSLLFIVNLLLQIPQHDEASLSFCPFLICTQRQWHIQPLTNLLSFSTVPFFIRVNLFGVHRSFRSRGKIKLGVQKPIFGVHVQRPKKNFGVHMTHSADWPNTTTISISILCCKCVPLWNYKKII